MTRTAQTFRAWLSEGPVEMSSLQVLLAHVYRWMADNPQVETVFVERVVESRVDLRIGLPGLANWQAVFDHAPVDGARQEASP